MTTTTDIRTDRFSGNCSNCVYPVVREREDLGSLERALIPCPECNTPVECERLYGTFSDHNCDSRCQYAVGNLCQCSCGGANHRVGFIPLVQTGTVASSVLSAFRIGAQRRAAQGQARREANAARKAANRAAIVARNVERTLAMRQQDADCPDLSDIAQAPAHANDWEKRTYTDIIARFYEKGYLSTPQYDLLKKIANKPVPRPEIERTIPAPSGRCAIAGDVVYTKGSDTEWGYIVKALILLDGGAKVWGTLPRGTEKGQRITFTATFSPKADDRFFAFYSRPASASVIGEARATHDASDENSLS